MVGCRNSLLVGWDAAGFMNHPPRPILDGQIYSVKFLLLCYLATSFLGFQNSLLLVFFYLEGPSSVTGLLSLISHYMLELSKSQFQGPSLLSFILESPQSRPLPLSSSHLPFSASKAKQSLKVHLFIHFSTISWMSTVGCLTLPQGHDRFLYVVIPKETPCNCTLCLGWGVRNINVLGCLGSLVSPEVLETLAHPGRHTELVILLSCSRTAYWDNFPVSLFQPCSGKSRQSNPNSLQLLGHEAEGQETIILIENRIRIYCFSNCA